MLNGQSLMLFTHIVSLMSDSSSSFEEVLYESALGELGIELPEDVEWSSDFYDALIAAKYRPRSVVIDDSSDAGIAESDGGDH